MTTRWFCDYCGEIPFKQTRKGWMVWGCYYGSRQLYCRKCGNCVTEKVDDQTRLEDYV